MKQFQAFYSSIVEELGKSWIGNLSCRVNFSLRVTFFFYFLSFFLSFLRCRDLITDGLRNQVFNSTVGIMNDILLGMQSRKKLVGGEQFP